jgi:hypothetical protein
MSEVPKASIEMLKAEVTRLNVPLTEANRPNHPLTQLGDQLTAEQPLIASWGSHLSANIDRALGAADDSYLRERCAFDNAYIAAYGLLRVGYDEHRLQVPTAPFKHGEEPFLEQRRSVDMQELFSGLNDRQGSLFFEYPEYLVAVQAYAYESMPGHGIGGTIGTVAIAASEVYYSFREL